MAAILVLGLGWFLGGLTIYVLVKKAGWWALVVIVIWLIIDQPRRESRDPSYPRPTGDSMEDRFRQKEWDDIKEGLNGS